MRSVHSSKRAQGLIRYAALSASLSIRRRLRIASLVRVVYVTSSIRFAFLSIWAHVLCLLPTYGAIAGSLAVYRGLPTCVAGQASAPCAAYVTDIGPPST